MQGSQKIENAIKEKRLLKVRYTAGERLIEPHTYGRGKKDGGERLRAYQVSGASVKGEHQGWKLFKVSRLEVLDVLEDKFSEPREGYTRGDSAFRIIYAEI